MQIEGILEMLHSKKWGDNTSCFPVGQTLTWNQLQNYSQEDKKFVHQTCVLFLYQISVITGVWEAQEVRVSELAY